MAGTQGAGPIRPCPPPSPVISYLFESKGFSRIDIDTNESDASYSFAGQLIGLPLKSLQGSVCGRVSVLARRSIKPAVQARNE